MFYLHMDFIRWLCLHFYSLDLLWFSLISLWVIRDSHYSIGRLTFLGPWSLNCIGNPLATSNNRTTYKKVQSAQIPIRFCKVTIEWKTRCRSETIFILKLNRWRYRGPTTHRGKMTRINRCKDITLAIIHVNTYVGLSTKNHKNIVNKK